MTVHKPAKIFLLGAAIYVAIIAGLNLVLSELAVTLIGMAGIVVLIASVFAWLILTEGDPPPPVSRQLPIRRSEIIDV
jgi:hypothetical protein